MSFASFLPLIEFANPMALALAGLIPFVLLLARRRVRTLKPARRHAVLGLRAMLLLALVVALAEPFTRQTEDRLSVVLILDASESAGGEAAARARLDQARALAGPRDRLAAVAFGNGAEVWLPWPEDDGPQTVDGRRWTVDDGQTTSGDGPRSTVHGPSSDLAAGLRLARALAAGEPNARLVLVSDGWTTGSVGATPAAPLLALPVAADVAEPETSAVALEGPGGPTSDRIYVREAEPFLTTAVIETTTAQSARLRAYVDDRLSAEIPIELTPGVNRLPLEQRADAGSASGGNGAVHRLAIEIEAPQDMRATNNRVEAVIVAQPRGRALILEERAGEGAALHRALSEAGIEAELRPAGSLGDLPTLAGFDAVVLANVAATSFTLDQQKTLQAFVGQRGGGLVVAGGRTTFALGDYAGTPIEAALPLSAEIPPRTEAASVALMLVLDRSYSMEEPVDGVKKIRMAAEAASLATESLRPGDYVGVLAFDTSTTWIVPLQRAEDNGGIPAIQQRIAGLTAGGGTQIYPALKTGFEAVKNAPTESRHIILMSDGRSYGDGNWDVLLGEFKAARVVLSTVALGSDADKPLMSRLAQLGEGRYHFTERVRDLPRLITREATVARQSPIVEGVIHPLVSAASPILRNLAPSDLPALRGYLAASPKPTAEVVLATDRGDPLLAQWQYGLGRSVAWTGGITPDWSADWLAWPRYSDFWAQAVRWAMPAPGNREFEPTVTVDGDRVTIRVDALQPATALGAAGFTDLADVRATVIAPDNRRHELRLPQSGPGRYETTAQVGPAGAYRIEVAQFNGAEKVRSEWTGLVVHPDPEHAHLGANEQLLRRVAAEHGGRVISDLSAAFDRSDLPPAQREVPLWPWPLTLAVLLFPLDIAARRLLT